MSISSNVTEQDVINLRKLAEHRKNYRAEKSKNRILKQTNDVKLAESLSTITRKLDTINESTKNLENFIIKALPNSSNFIDSMRKTIGSLMRSKISLKIAQNESRSANILGVPIQITGADTIKMSENIYESTPEVYKALSYTGYSGKNKKNENDILMMNKNIRDIGYTGREDRDSKSKTFSTKTLPKLFEENQN